MDLKEIMKFQNWVVLGNTIDESKYAAKIKTKLLEIGKTVACADKELDCLNDAPFEIDVLDLCVNKFKGINMLKEATVPFKVVLIQPGAESPEIIEYLTKNNIDFLEGCALVGARLYPEGE